MDINGAPSPGRVVGRCRLGPLQFLVVTSDGFDTSFVDVNENGTHDEEDPIITLLRQPVGLDIAVRFPSAFGPATVPADATGQCTFSQLVIPTRAGDHVVEVEVDSIDLDTLGESDGSGSTPYVVSDRVGLHVAGSSARRSSAIRGRLGS